MSRINGVVGGVVRPVVRGLTSNKGVGVPYPAPSGYRWATVVENGVPVTEGGQLVMELQRIAA